MSQNRPFGQSIFKLLALLAFAACFATGFAQDEEPAEPPGNLPLRVEGHQTLDEDVFGYKRTVQINGTVVGEVTGLQADIHLQGSIKGNLTVLGGTVMFYKGARVEGNIMCVGGRLINMRSADITGNVNHFLDPEKQRVDVIDSTPAAASFFFGRALIVFLLVIAIFYVFPNQVHEAGFHLSADLVRAVIVGATTNAAFVGGIIISVLLMVVGIGYPLFLIFIAAYLLVAGFGVVIVFYRLGLWFNDLSKGKASVTSGILLAVLIFTALSSISGLTTFIVGAIVLFGSGIVMDTRFGTNKQWFTRKSRYWGA